MSNEVEVAESGQPKSDRESIARFSLRLGILALILAVAGLLRFWEIANTGIFSVDEGRYLLDAESKLNEMHVYADLFRGKFEEMRGGREFLLSCFLPDARERLARRAPFLPKILFSYLIAIVMGFTGFTVWAGNAVEAAFGVLMVWATYWLGARLRNPRTGLIAAGMLALSCYHLYFSRNSYPQCISAFFLLICVVFHHKWSDSLRFDRFLWGCLVVSGMCAGLSFLANFQVGGALPALALVHSVVSMRGGTLVAKMRRFVLGGAVIGCSFLAILFAAEAASYPMILLFRSQGMAYPHQTFLELLMPRLGAHTQVAMNWQGAVLFPYFVFLFEGPAGPALAVALLVLGLWAGLRNRRTRPKLPCASPAFQRWAYLGIMVGVPWAIFSFKTLQGARTFLYIYPFCAILLAGVVDAIWGMSASPRAFSRVLTITLLLVTAFGVSRQDVEVLRMRSAYPAAIQWLKDNGAGGASATWSSVLTCYLRSSGLEGGSYYDYVSNAKEPPPYFLSDWQELYYARYPDECSVVPAGAPAECVFQHQFGRVFLEAEAMPSYGRTLSSIRFVRSLDLGRARELCVYDLKWTGVRAPGVQRPPATALWDTFPG